MNYNRVYLWAILMLLSSFSVCLLCENGVHAEEGTRGTSICSDCNQKDKQGRKVGLWIESDGLKEIYFKKGVMDGLYKSYYPKNSKLEGLGEYKDGRPSGIWYYFDETSHLTMIEKNIRKNTHLTVKRDDGRIIKPSFQAYVFLYYPNGFVKEEGIALYDKDIEMDFVRKGVWKYYDEAGNLIKPNKGR